MQSGKLKQGWPTYDLVIESQKFPFSDFAYRQLLLIPLVLLILANQEHDGWQVVQEADDCPSLLILLVRLLSRRGSNFPRPQ